MGAAEKAGFGRWPALRPPNGLGRGGTWPKRRATRGKQVRRWHAAPRRWRSQHLTRRPPSPVLLRMKKNTALVVGGNGIIGRNTAQYLVATGEWNVLISSRSPLGFETTATFLVLDLLQENAVLAQREALRSVTHVFSPLTSSVPPWPSKRPPTPRCSRTWSTAWSRWPPTWSTSPSSRAARLTGPILAYTKRRRWKPMPGTSRPTSTTTKRTTCAGPRLASAGAGRPCGPTSWWGWPSATP